MEIAVEATDLEADVAVAIADAWSDGGSWEECAERAAKAAIKTIALWQAEQRANAPNQQFNRWLAERAAALRL